MDMYNSSIECFQEWNSDEEDKKSKEFELKGAADILAWLLEVSEKIHKNNLKKIRNKE